MLFECKMLILTAKNACSTGFLDPRLIFNFGTCWDSWKKTSNLNHQLNFNFLSGTINYTEHNIKQININRYSNWK